MSIKKLIFTAVSFILSMALFAQTPGGVRGASIWYKTTDSTFLKKEYTDYSEYKNKIYVDVDNNRPSEILYNYNESLFFDGIDDYLLSNIVFEDKIDCVIFTVQQNNDSISERTLLYTDQAFEKDFSFGTKSISGYKSSLNYKEKPSTLPSLNTYVDYGLRSSRIQNSKENFKETKLSVGAENTEKEWKSFKGKIPEFIIFSKALNKVERNRIESYLALKYGLTLEKNNNYVSSTNAKLWSKENTEFWNHIAGIGRDDYSELYQKQSSSSLEDKRLIISNNSLALKNSLNTSHINNNDFLVWGDNNDSLKFAGDTINKQLIPLKRKWLMQASGNSVGFMDTQVRLKVSDLIKKDILENNQTIWLVKSPNKEDSFLESSELEFYTADVVDEYGYAEFNAIRWDENQDGKDVFGFAVGPNMLLNLRAYNPSCTNFSSQVQLEVEGGKSPYTVRIKNQDTPFNQSYTINNNELNISGLIAGDYDVEVSDSRGRTYSKAFAIDASKLFALDLGKDKTITKGNEFVLDASENIADEKASYLWSSDNGFSSTSSKITITEPGDYVVTVTSSEGCEVQDTISVSYSDQTIGITISPNPTNLVDGIHVIANLSSVYDIKASVYDASGKLVGTYKSNGEQQYEFVLKVPTEGVYLVVVEAGEQVYTKKVIVNKSYN